MYLECNYQQISNHHSLCSSNAGAIRVHVVGLKQEITVFGEIK